jgi:hypothetical protein
MTILEPLSTRRFSQACDANSPALFSPPIDEKTLPEVKDATTLLRGANCTSCDVVVKITNPEATVKEFTLLASKAESSVGIAA